MTPFSVIEENRRSRKFNFKFREATNAAKAHVGWSGGANVPTVGIGKNLHHVDGLNQSRVRQLLEAEGNLSKDVFTLIGDSGSTLGAAIRSTQDTLKPIFISVGHRVSLASAIKIVKMSCRFRVPEPIRQADIRSKACLRNHGLS
ncbi:endonuclease V family protein [Abeliophyllum distichum]|uniref:Endonuclease V family protein n=1 Tax=Abeliophyllum distichum TaxID=126358 RepID=A0ABD1TXE8_9LAMI